MKKAKYTFRVQVSRSEQDSANRDREKAAYEGVGDNLLEEGKGALFSLPNCIPA